MSEHENFFLEVEEDVRLERVKAFWKKYQTFLMGSLAVCMVLTLGGGYWYYRQEVHRGLCSQIFAEALAKIQKNDETALPLLERLKTEKGYGALALLVKGAHLAKENNSAAALEAFKGVQDTKSSDKRLFSLATLLMSYVLLENDDLTQVQESLPLLKDVNNPWQTLGIEVEAQLNNQQGNYQKEKEIYTALRERAGSSQGLLARASAILETIH